MIFNIAVGNNPLHLWGPMGDLVAFLRAAVEANGHTVLVSDYNAITDGINLFIDRFFRKAELAANLRGRGIRYGVIVTEHIDQAGVLNFGAETLTDELVEPVRHADFVWCLVEESVPFCRTLNPETLHLKLGYVPALAMPQPALLYKDLEFVVTGLTSVRRERILGELRGRGFRAHCTNHAPGYVRDGLLARSRFNISLQKIDGQRMVSVTRICHSLLHRVPIILEIDAATAPSPYMDFCLIAQSETLLDQCAVYARDVDFIAYADDMLRRFTERMNMVSDMRPLLDRLR